MTILNHSETVAPFSTEQATTKFALPYVLATRVLVSMVVLTIALGIFREWFVYRYGLETIFQDMRHIALDAEMCLNAWFSASMMLMSAILLFCIARLSQRHQHGDVAYWYVLSAVFVAMSLDEETSVHELFLEPIRNTLQVSGFFYYAWVVPALVLVPLFALAYRRFLLRLPRTYGLWIFISGAIFVSGALGMEMVGGWADVTYGEHSLQVVVCYVIEESMELIGMASFVIALMSYLRQTYPRDLIALN